MQPFATYLSDLSARRGLRRQIAGGSVIYRLRLQASAAVTVITDELDPTAIARATSEPWPIPQSAGAYGEFMRTALQFNRSALHHLDCGILQDPANPGQFRLTWFVAPLSLPDSEWARRLKLFGTLTDKAWSTMPVPGQSGGPPRPGNDEAGHVIFMP